MKKLLALFIILTMIFVGCGGGAKDTAKAAGKKATPKKEVKKELVVNMMIGEKELKFVKASFLSNAMTPNDKTTTYTLYGTPEGGDSDALNIEFDSAVKGKVHEVYVSLKKYKIESSTINLEIFEAKKHQVTTAKGTFSGKLKMTGKNGFPTGDLIDFTGSFVK